VAAIFVVSSSGGGSGSSCSSIIIISSSSSGGGGSNSSCCFECGSVGGGSQKEMAVGSRVIMEVFCHFGGGGLIRGNCYSYLPLKI